MQTPSQPHPSSPEPPPLPANTPKRRSRLSKIAIGLGALVVLCCGLGAIGAVLSPSRGTTPGATPAATIAATIAATMAPTAPAATAAPEPTTPPTIAPSATSTATPRVSAEGAAYLLKIAPITDDIAAAIGNIAELSQEASENAAVITSGDWKLRIAVEMAALKIAANRLRDLPSAPAGLERVGDKARAIASELDLIVANFTAGVDELDTDKITAAGEAMQRASALAVEMRELVE